MLLAAAFGIAGVSIGIALCLAFLNWTQIKQIRALNAERMLLWNKLLVRDGQTMLFSDRMVAGDIEPRESKPMGVKTFKSPFRAGLDSLRKDLTNAKKPGGGNLPPNITHNITQAAEKAKSQDAA